MRGMTEILFAPNLPDTGRITHYYKTETKKA